MTTTRRGLSCDIYRPAGGSCANGGISNHVDTVVLVGGSVPEIFTPTDNAPAVQLGLRGNYLFATPVTDPEPGHTWWMFGGSFIYTSDSRFSEVHPLAKSGAPIPLHDRSESADLAAVLSR